MASNDLPSCDCDYTCNRHISKRNGCPCYTAKVLCSIYCNCGTETIPCLNRPGPGGDLEEELQDDDDQDWVSASFEEGQTICISGLLNTSLQEEAEKQTGTRHRQDVGDDIGALPDNTVVSSFANMDQSDNHLNKVDSLSKGQLRTILKKILHFAPELTRFMNSDNPDQDPQQPGQLAAPWCKCTRCREMPTPTEQRCCRLTKGLCVLTTAAADLNATVFDRRVLQLGIQNRNALYAQTDDMRAVNSLRHMAYRFYVLQKHGYQGANRRRVIPSCVVWAIREKYPSTDGIYTGFIRVRAR